MNTANKQSSKIGGIITYVKQNPKRAFQIFYVSIFLLLFSTILVLYSINVIHDNAIDISIFIFLALIVLVAYTDRWVSRRIILDSKLLVAHVSEEESGKYKKNLISNIKNRNVLIYVGLAFLAMIINMGLLLAKDKSTIYLVDLVIILAFCLTKYITFLEISKIGKSVEIVISRTGAIVFGDLVIWNERGVFAWLRKITFNPSEDRMKANLIIDMAWFTRVGNMSRQLVIPVSKEQEELIPNIVSILEEVKETNKYNKYDQQQ